jgi:hypothetical protein
MAAENTIIQGLISLLIEMASSESFTVPERVRLGEEIDSLIESIDTEVNA